MTRLVCAAAAVVMLAVPGVAACARNSDGTAVRVEASTSTSPSTNTDAPESSEPGVLETTRVPIPPDTTVCQREQPGPTAVAAVADRGAPQIRVRVPPGWSSTPGTGDVGAVLSGPDDMVADVTIAATPLDPAAAFTRYGDDVMAKYPISTLSLLPGDFCGFSGQKLIGTWARDPDESLEYQDRIAHIWTNNGNYLVAVHVEAPSGAPGFDAAASMLTDDFGVVIP
ncbi:hypothetical protein ORI20_30985 [Mycobacterium sp. CVI_P3]|uniref:Lipoprotein LpqN n=1 Tax=Mycobacterium pinniadriaticum TaxID=2994102 RepID=A0ABT3SNL6_9MYCO|nr:hypothetical protein [Mycobacterium pinniadriaticum]MCX2934699.1 hypothetical protein [Mycobacterium pinniadriaticum]MCX2941121.1 hypothetical protein [Mycobacterium pinniadriaticum]